MTHRLTPAEVRAAREYFGLTLERFASLMGVHVRTVQSWEQGRDPVPTRVHDEIGGLFIITETAVKDLIEFWHRMPGGRIEVWRDDASMEAAWPDMARYGARWWRHVAERAMAELPQARIHYVD